MMESAVKTIIMALAHCRFCGIYGSSLATSIEDLGTALASLYAAIIIFFTKIKNFLDDNASSGAGIYSHKFGGCSYQLF